MQIFLGLGSNLGDREMNLVKARDLLMKHDVLVIGQSDIRETKPLGGKDQPMYLNQVVECRTNLSPEQLLVACKSVEKEMGRKVESNIGNVAFGSGSDNREKKWDSRIIDLDILFYGDKLVDSSILTIPHVGTYDRAFLMECMCDLDENFLHPRLKKSMKELNVKA